MTMKFTISKHNSQHNEDGFETIETNFTDLPKYIMSGGYCSNSLVNGSRRKNKDSSLPTGYESYNGGESALILDVDDGFTIEMAQEFFKEFNCLIITTKKHQKTIDGVKYGDRFRIILEIDEINDFNERQIIIKEIYKTYSFIDQACKNPNRFFFASPPDALVLENITGVKFDINIFKTYANAELLSSLEATNEVKEVSEVKSNEIYRYDELREIWKTDSGDVLEQESTNNEEAKLKGINIFLDDNFYQGNKSNSLFNASCMMKRDGFDDDFIVTHLIKQWERRSSGKDKFKDAVSNIKNGLRYN